MRIRFSHSIANAIFALAAVLIALMAIVAAINTVLSLQVGEAIGSINRTALPVYANLARAHIRTLEQSVALRQAAISILSDSDAGQPDPSGGKAGAGQGRTPPVPGPGGTGAPEESLEASLAAEAKAGKAAEQELASAQATLAAQADRPGAPGDKVLLGRLQVQIEQALHIREQYQPARAHLLSALKERRADEIALALEQLDTIRSEQNESFEAARREARAFAGQAVEATQASGQEVIRLTLVMLALAVLLGALMAFWIARRLVSAIRRLVSATEAVEQGRYDADIPVTSDDEIGRLTRSFNLMLAELRLKEKIRDTFGRYLDPKVVANLLESPAGVGTAGERHRMTILFVDMAGFSHLAEEVSPGVLVNVLNRYLSLLTEAVRSQQGIVDKYLGDGMMAFWGPPFVEDAGQGRLAWAAALAQVEAFAQFRQELPELLGIRSFRPRIGLRIGLATGEVIAGSIGSALAMNYTVLGDTVNVASRLEGLNKLYGTTILMTQETAALLPPDTPLREIDRVAVAGREGPVTIFEALLPEPAGGDGTSLLRAAYARGLAAYRSRDWDAAEQAFRAALALRPEDGPSATLLARIERFRTEPPPGDWDGSFTASRK